MKLPAWYTQMNERERLLSSIVAGVVLLLINLFLWSWIFGAMSRGHAELAARRSERQQQIVYLRERDLWAKREQWLQQHQPVFKGPGDASTLLDQQIKPVAGKYNILIENPQIGSGETTANHQSVWASLETKSPWGPLVHFLYDVQQPEAFIVFENVNLIIDSNDATLMKGKFRIARWYAPKKG